MSKRRFELWLIFIVLLAFGASQVNSASSSFTVAPPPAWIEPVPTAQPSDASAPEASSGIKYLLVDHQIRVHEKMVEQYYRRMKKVLSAAKLESASQLQLDFEPSYQKLVIHHIRIERGQQVIDALKPREIKIIQQENELDQRLYNGTLSAVVFLNDVRVGDTIDYAYSVNGENPILGGRFAETLWLAASEPVELLRRRLLWPVSRQLQVKNQATQLQPVMRERGQEREYVWERRQVPALDYEDGTPDWFDPTPKVQLSEFANWGEVVNWAVPLYATNRTLSPELTKQVDRWRAEFSQSEARFLAALRFVQDEIRYLGIEMGPHSHLPHAPASVFARRFGDCKDKSLLLSTILNALGIEAYPALVNTKTHHTLNDWQPSPFAFDHVIVQVKLDGKTYWVDPTASLQRGGLQQLANPDYARALVVRADNHELEEIPPPTNAASGIAVKEVYTADHFDEPATFEIVTTYRGEDADAMRHKLAEQSLTELGKQYLNYYAGNDPEITAQGLPQVSDQPETNTLVITEKYQIPNFWRDESRDFLADQINRELMKPAISRRTAPLAVPHPINITQTIEVHLPEIFNLAPDSGTIEDEAIRFQYQRDFRNHTLKLNYTFQSRLDHVLAKQVTKHLATIDRIQQTINYRLSRGNARQGKAGNVVLGLFCSLLGLGIIVGGIIAGVRSWRLRERRQGFKDLQRLAPGAAPETAIRLTTEAELARHLPTFQCACGQPYYQPHVPLHQEGVIFDGRRLTVVQFKCERCGHNRDIYFDRLYANIENTGSIAELS